MLQDSDRTEDRQGTNAAGEADVFVLKSQELKSQESKPQEKLGEALQGAREGVAAAAAKVEEKVESWTANVGSWVRRHWPALAVGGAVFTGAMTTTWLLCRRRQRAEPLGNVRRFLHVD